MSECRRIRLPGLDVASPRSVPGLDVRAERAQRQHHAPRCGRRAARPRPARRPVCGTGHHVPAPVRRIDEQDAEFPRPIPRRDARWRHLPRVSSFRVVRPSSREAPVRAASLRTTSTLGRARRKWPSGTRSFCASYDNRQRIGPRGERSGALFCAKRIVCPSFFRLDHARRAPTAPPAPGRFTASTPARRGGRAHFPSAHGARPRCRRRLPGPGAR